MSHRIRPPKPAKPQPTKPQPTKPQPPQSSERLNRYVCQVCGRSIITIDRDEGVTPFMLNCRATPDCKGDMHSSFYEGVTGQPTHEWRKPTAEEYQNMSQPMRDYIDSGALNIYPLAEANEVQNAPQNQGEQ